MAQNKVINVISVASPLLSSRSCPASKVDRLKRRQIYSNQSISLGKSPRRASVCQVIY
jgi:hypothetical protein